MGVSDGFLDIALGHQSLQRKDAAPVYTAIHQEPVPEVRVQGWEQS